MLAPTIVHARQGIALEQATLPRLSSDLVRFEMNFNGEAAAFDLRFLASAWALGRNVNGRSPFLEPLLMQELVDRYHAAEGITWSHGGYLEDRTDLWRGGYLKEPVIHGGIDVSLPAGTPVRCMRDGTVVWVDDDKNPDGGWGPYIVVQTRNCAGRVEFVLFGHLGRSFVEIGDAVVKGDVIADIGAPPDNGGWWSHLHLQCISHDYYDWCCENDINKTLDGYFPASEVDLFKARFPDPTPLLWNATTDVAEGSRRYGLLRPS